MDWLSEQNNIRIKHAKNGGEEKVEGIMVDGVDENGTLYMFQGCFWHGCDKCYSKSSTLHPVKQIPMKDLRQHTRHQIHTLRSNRAFTLGECARVGPGRPSLAQKSHGGRGQSSERSRWSRVTYILWGKCQKY